MVMRVTGASNDWNIRNLLLGEDAISILNSLRNGKYKIVVNGEALNFSDVSEVYGQETGAAANAASARNTVKQRLRACGLTDQEANEAWTKIWHDFNSENLGDGEIRIEIDRSNSDPTLY